MASAAPSRAPSPTFDLPLDDGAYAHSPAVANVLEPCPGRANAARTAGARTLDARPRL